MQARGLDRTDRGLDIVRMRVACKRGYVCVTQCESHITHVRLGACAPMCRRTLTSGEAGGLSHACVCLRLVWGTGELTLATPAGSDARDFPDMIVVLIVRHGRRESVEAGGRCPRRTSDSPTRGGDSSMAVVVATSASQ